MKPCEYEFAPGQKCGMPATAVVKAKAGTLSHDTGDGMGRGVGSVYIPVCLGHERMFPDHDGFRLPLDEAIGQ